MGGRMSRNKGARGERSLCMHLNMLGYDARRVIRTRAVGGYGGDVVPDVIAVKDGIEFTFESKYKKSGYETIYRLYERERCGQNVCRLHLGARLVVIGSDFEEVKKSGDTHFRTPVPLDHRENLTYQKMLGLEKLLKGAMFLAIKQNGKYPLFLRFG